MKKKNSTFDSKILPSGRYEHMFETPNCFQQCLNEEHDAEHKRSSYYLTTCLNKCSRQSGRAHTPTVYNLPHVLFLSSSQRKQTRWTLSIKHSCIPTMHSTLIRV